MGSRFRFLVVASVILAAMTIVTSAVVVTRAATQGTDDASPTPGESAAADDFVPEEWLSSYQEWLDEVAEIPQNPRDNPLVQSSFDRRTYARGDLNTIFDPNSSAVSAAVIGTVTRFLGFAPAHSDLEFEVERWLAVRDGETPGEQTITLRQAMTLGHRFDLENPEALTVYASGEAILIPGDRVLLLLMKDPGGVWNHVAGHGTWRISDGSVIPDLGPDPDYVDLPDEPLPETGGYAEAINAEIAWMARYEGMMLEDLVAEITETAQAHGWSTDEGTAP